MFPTAENKMTTYTAHQFQPVRRENKDKTALNVSGIWLLLLGELLPNTSRQHKSFWCVGRGGKKQRMRARRRRGG